MAKQRASLHDRTISMAPSVRTTDDLILGVERRRQEVQELLLREVMPNRFQPRSRPNAEGMLDLAASIRQHGVIEPIIVRSITLTLYEGMGCRYELIAGERRWRASALAGLATIPALVLGQDTDDRAMLELAITENLQREDLHPLDEALAFSRMQTELGYSYAQLAERLGKSKGYIQNRMRLLQIAEDLQQLVTERSDTLGHVYEIDRVSDPMARAELIAAVRDDRISRAETRARVEALLVPEPAVTGSYFQKYDASPEADTRRPEEGADASPEAAARRPEGGAKAESYFQKYDSPTTPGLAGLLTPRERAALVTAAGKLVHGINDPTLLTTEDWVALETIAGHLGALLTLNPKPSAT